MEQEKEKESEACRIQEEQLRLEVQRMAERGYEERVSQWWLLFFIFIRVLTNVHLRSDSQQTSFSMDLSTLKCKECIFFYSHLSFLPFHSDSEAMISCVPY